MPYVGNVMGRRRGRPTAQPSQLFTTNASESYSSNATTFGTLGMRLSLLKRGSQEGRDDQVQRTGSENAHENVIQRAFLTEDHIYSRSVSRASSGRSHGTAAGRLFRKLLSKSGGADVGDQLEGSTPGASFDDDSRRTEYRTGVRQTIFLALTEPGSSWTAWVVSVMLLLLIVLSSTTFCLETLPGNSHDFYYTLGLIEWISIIIFTLEYILKVACAPEPLAQIRNPFNIIDLLAIVPFYISLAIDPASLMFWKPGVLESSTEIQGADTRILRVVRLIRVLRVLKLSKRIARFDVIATSILESSDMLIMLIFLLVLATVVCSAFIFYAEHDHWEQLAVNDELDSSVLGPNGDTNPFGSIPECFWWCLVTLMTVGYGDVVPLTAAGQMAASFTMLVSVVIMALPISVIGAAFTQNWATLRSQESVIERSGNVLPVFKELKAQTNKQFRVLSDLVHTLHALKQHTDETVGTFRDDAAALTEASELASFGATIEQSPVGMFRSNMSLSGAGNSAKRKRRLTEVTTSSMGENSKIPRALNKAVRSGTAANRSWKVLKDLHELSELTASELVKVEHMHMAYRNLKKWFDEGEVLQREIDSLLNEVQEVTDFLHDQANPRPVTTNAGSTTD